MSDKPAHPTNLGGSAFPSVHSSRLGMSLRDFFAAATIVSLGPTYILKVEQGYDEAANACWRMADAMLKARDARLEAGVEVGA